MILPIAAGFLAVNAGAEEVVIPKNSDGCFEISTAEQLLGFAQHINNNIDQHDDDHDHKNDCALLMNDIKFSGDTKVVKDDLTGVNSVPFKSWEPLREFAGTFDGQGHTISGLYYVAPETTEDGKKGRRDAGFFAHLSGHAKVVNVRVEDSYFAADERAGGIAADVKSGSEVYIDNVSFKGVVSSYKTDCTTGFLGSGFTRVNGYIGGLIGTVSQGAKIINLSNSFNEGTVTTGKCGVWDDNNPKMGGLIGVIQDLADVNESGVKISNCYNAGTVTTSTYSGLSIKSADGPSIIGKLEGDKSTTADKISAENVGCAKNQATYCSTTNSDPSKLAEAYEKNIDDQIQEALQNPPEGTPAAEGISIEMGSGSKRVAYLKLTDSDNQVIIPQDILVDSIVLDRSFSTNRSTITLPFSISVDKVKDSQGQPVDFYTLDAMTVTDENKWEVEATKLSVGAINAHTPYLVQAKNEGPITFDGSVTLKAANGEARFSSISYAAGDWSFKGVYTKKTWVDDERAQEGCEECGRSYIFSNNKFMKVGKSGGVLPYRAYLMAPVPFRPALAKAAAGATVENPSEIAIRVLGTDENKYSTYDVVFQKAEPIEIIESIDDPEGESQSLRQPVMMPAKRSSNKWADVKGRSMNRKPTAKGVYINNEIPVIVK